MCPATASGPCASECFSRGTVWFLYNKNFVKRKSFMHGGLNVVCLQNFFRDDVTFRDESNDGN